MLLHTVQVEVHNIVHVDAEPAIIHVHLGRRNLAHNRGRDNNGCRGWSRRGNCGSNIHCGSSVDSECHRLRRKCGGGGASDISDCRVHDRQRSLGRRGHDGGRRSQGDDRHVQDGFRGRRDPRAGCGG